MKKRVIFFLAEGRLRSDRQGNVTLVHTKVTVGSRVASRRRSLVPRSDEHVLDAVEQLPDPSTETGEPPARGAAAAAPVRGLFFGHDVKYVPKKSKDVAVRGRVKRRMPGLAEKKRDARPRRLDEISRCLLRDRRRRRQREEEGDEADVDDHPLPREYVGGRDGRPV